MVKTSYKKVFLWEYLFLIDIYYKDTYVGKYAWVLSNIKKYNKTIPIKGKLGLWNYNV